MSGEIEIVGPRDQPTGLAPASEAEWELLGSRIDLALERCEAEGTLEPALDLALELRASGIQRAIALGRLLYEGWKRAERFGLTKGGYLDLVYVRVGLSPSTTRRYIERIWPMCAPGSPVPPELRPRLLERPLRDIDYMARRLLGRKVRKSDWKRLLTAEDHAALRAEVARILGGEESQQGGAVVRLHRDGRLVLWDEEGSVHLGFLLVEDADLKDERRCKAIAQIVDRARIVTDVVLVPGGTDGG